MDFRRIDDNNIRCQITEEEIEGMGYSLEEIMTNGNRTKEFMDRIFTMAQKACHTEFSLDIRTVKAELHPDHSLDLVFSQHSIEEVADSDALINNLLEAVRNELKTRKKRKEDKQDRIKPDTVKSDTVKSDKVKPDKAIEDNPWSDPESESGQDAVQIVVILVFDDMDRAIRFARQLPKDLIPENSLYRYQKKYYVRMNLSTFSQKQVERLSMITDEYVEEILAGTARSAFIAEHGELLIGTDAIGRLKEL